MVPGGVGETFLASSMLRATASRSSSLSLASLIFSSSCLCFSSFFLSFASCLFLSFSAARLFSLSCEVRYHGRERGCAGWEEMARLTMRYGLLTKHQPG